MNARRLALAFTSLIAISACGGLTGAFAVPTGTKPFDLLVVPPPDSGLPPALLPSSKITTQGLDIALSAGHEFRGTVVDTSSNGIAQVQVRAVLKAAGVDVVTTTDTAGRFTMALSDGLYDVYLVPPGALGPGTQSYPPLTLRDFAIAGAAVTSNYVMTPGYAVTGHVYAPGSGVNLQGWHVSATDAAGDPSSFADSNALGFFIQVATTGGWTLSLVAPAGSSLPSVSLPIVVGPGPNVDDYAFPASVQTSQLTGPISGDGTHPITGTKIRAKALLPSGDASTWTFDQSVTADSSGAFAMSVPKGTSYTVIVDPGYASPYSHVTQTALDLSADHALALSLPAKTPVTGSAANAGSPVAGAKVQLIAADGVPYEWDALTAADGSWQIPASASGGTGVDLGDYQLVVLPPSDSGYVRVATAESVTTTQTSFQSTPPAGARVVGRILDPDHKAVANAFVAPLDPGAGLVPEPHVGAAEPITDGSGGFTLTVPVSP